MTTSFFHCLPLIFLFRVVGELLLLEGLTFGTSTSTRPSFSGFPDSLNFISGSIQRSIYKDLIRLLQGNIFLNETMLRLKSKDAKTY
jgi:hypothetical protein